MTKNNEFLGTEKIGKIFFKLALPAVVAQVVNMLYNLVDRIFIGHMPGGDLALTGVGVCFPLIILINAFGVLISMGGAPIVGMHMGRQDYKKAEQCVGACFGTALIFSVILTVAGILFNKPILELFGASPNTIGYATDYMNIYILGTIFVILALGMNAFINVQGFAMTAMLSTLIGAVLNIGLDPIFIYVLGMGVKGAALATIISQFASAVWVIWFLVGKKTILKIRLKDILPKPKIILPCLALGISPFIMQATESLLGICFNISLKSYGGDIAVGAMTIAASIKQFTMIPLNGVGQGAQPIISYNYGANKLDRVRKTFGLFFCISFGVCFVVWGLVELFPQVFVGIFADKSELMTYAIWALRIYFAGMVVFGIQFSCQQAFVAMGYAKISTFLALLRKVILLIPLIYILPAFMEDKDFAVWLAEPIADVVAAIITGTMFIILLGKKLLGKKPMLDKQIKEN